MRFKVFLTILAALLPLAGCETQTTPPAQPANNRSGVEIHTPNVDVKSNKEGTTVTAPGTDVRVQKESAAK